MHRYNVFPLILSRFHLLLRNYR